MKQVIGKQMFSNAEELLQAIESLLDQARKARTTRDGSKLWDSEVSCQFGDIDTLVLIEEELTDGSHVYNLELK